MAFLHDPHLFTNRIRNRSEFSLFMIHEQARIRVNRRAQKGFTCIGPFQPGFGKMIIGIATGKRYVSAFEIGFEITE